MTTPTHFSPRVPDSCDAQALLVAVNFSSMQIALEEMNLVVQASESPQSSPLVVACPRPDRGGVPVRIIPSVAEGRGVSVI